MADIKISALSAASALGGTEAIPTVQSGSTVRTTPNAILTLIESVPTVYSVATAGPVLKQGANGLCGTFVANGVTPVVVTNTNIAITDAIIISLNTIGGTVGVQPHVSAITATTSFAVTCTATDTSTYNYAIIKNGA